MTRPTAPPLSVTTLSAAALLVAAAAVVGCGPAGPAFDPADQRYDAGVVLLEAGQTREVTRRFIVPNPTDRPMRLSEAWSSCGCTSAVVGGPGPEDDLIPPGGSVAVTVTVRCGATGREQVGTVAFDTGAAEMPLVRLTVSVTGVPPVTFESDGAANGPAVTLPPGGSRRLELTVAASEIAAAGDPFAPPALTADRPFVRVLATEEQSRRTVLNPDGKTVRTVRTRVVCEIAADDGGTAPRRTATLTARSGGATATVPVTVVRHDPVRVRPPAALLTGGGPAVVTVSADRPFRLLSVEPNGWSVVADPPAGGPPRSSYRLRIAAGPGGAGAGLIRLGTDHPDRPRVAVPVVPLGK